MQNFISLGYLVLEISAFQYEGCHGFRAGASVHKLFVGGVYQRRAAPTTHNVTRYNARAIIYGDANFFPCNYNMLPLKAHVARGNVIIIAYTIPWYDLFAMSFAYHLPVEIWIWCNHCCGTSISFVDSIDHFIMRVLQTPSHKCTYKMIYFTSNGNKMPNGLYGLLNSILTDSETMQDIVQTKEDNSIVYKKWCKCVTKGNLQLSVISWIHPLLGLELFPSKCMLMLVSMAQRKTAVNPVH